MTQHRREEQPAYEQSVSTVSSIDPLSCEEKNSRGGIRVNEKIDEAGLKAWPTRKRLAFLMAPAAVIMKRVGGAVGFTEGSAYLEGLARLQRSV